MKKIAILSMCLLMSFSYAQQKPSAPNLPSATALPLQYGVPISLTEAKKIMAAAEAEALKNNWPVAIAIFDSTGHLVMFEKLDNTQYGSIKIAKGKALSALDFKRPTKSFEDALAGGGNGLRILGMHNVTPLEGGILLMKDGKIVGSIGVSGVQSSQDAQVANAGAKAIENK